MKAQLKLLADALSMLACDADVQLKYLCELGTPEGVDELALEYDDIAAAADTMLQEGDINERQHNSVKKLTEWLKRMSGPANAHLWTVEALRSAKEWSYVRTLADKCLALLRDADSSA